MFFFVDTETTGIKPTDRVVSVCWMVFGPGGERLRAEYRVIRPEGFKIPIEASRIHGITTDQAMREGAPLRDVLHRLNGDVVGFAPALLIGHNIAFDRPILLNEFSRVGLPERLSPLRTFCTMRSTTDLCRIPNARGWGYKWPNLDELHRYLFSQGMTGAHNAEADVETCAKCFFELKRRRLAVF